MKKSIYIAFLLVGLVFVSCQKEDFTPNVKQDNFVPFQEENARGVDFDSTSDGISDDGSIVDPDDEEDASENTKNPKSSGGG